MELERSVIVGWRKFMTTEAGIKGMLWLRTQVPSVTRGSETEIIFDAGIAEGVKRSFDLIDQLLAGEPKEAIDPSNDK